MEKGDFEKTQAQHARNFTFFDAPVGLIFTINRGLEIGELARFRHCSCRTSWCWPRSHGFGNLSAGVAFATLHTVIQATSPAGRREDATLLAADRQPWQRADWSKAERTHSLQSGWRRKTMSAFTAINRAIPSKTGKCRRDSRHGFPADTPAARVTGSRLAALRGRK